MQNDSPIPMQDQDENKKSNAIELHEAGLENVFKAILKQDANKLKKQLKQIELEKTDYQNEKKDE